VKQRGIFEKVHGSGIWWVRYALANGKIRREKAGTKSAAISLYRKRKTEVLEGKKLPEPRQRLVTFREIARDVLAYSRTHHRERTQYVVGRQVAKFMGQFGDTPAEQITPQRVMEFLAGNTKTKATYNRWRSLLSLIFRWAIENGKVSLNPIHKVPRHKNEDNKRTRFLRPEEEERLRKVIREHWPEEEPILELYLHTGLRGGNLFDLRWKDVDLELDLLTVAETKADKPLYLEINSAARQAFEILAVRRASPSMADERVCPNGYRHFTKWFKKALSRAEIQDFRPHDLRHTFGSRLTMRGVPLRTIQELMGHRDIATTLRYSHLSDAHRRAAVEELVKLAAEGPAETPKRTDTQTDTRPRLLASHEKPTVM
jgi:integrase